MARKTNFYSLVLFLVSTMFMVLLTFPAAIAMAHHVQKETTMTFYLHDYSGGPNSTDVPIVGFAGKLWNSTQFGTIYVIDDLITEGPELTSPTVGRGQGISVVASLDGLNAHASLSFVFTNQAYNGSTIQMQGTSNQFQTIMEYSVVSGTGKFHYVRGYIVLELIAYDPYTYYTLYCTNLTIRH